MMHENQPERADRRYRAQHRGREVLARSHAPTWRPLTPLSAGLLTGYRSGAAARHIFPALATPALAEFAVMKPSQQMRVMIQLVGRTQHLLKVTAVIARRGFFLGPLTDNAQLFPAQLDDFGQYLFQIHRVLSPRPPGPPCLQSSRRQTRSARHEAASRTRARPLTSGLSRAAIAAVTEADPWAQPTPDLAAEHPTPGPVRWQEKHPAPSAAQLETDDLITGLHVVRKSEMLSRVERETAVSR